jgi:hypothetical protein
MIEMKAKISASNRFKKFFGEPEKTVKMNNDVLEFLRPIYFLMCNIKKMRNEIKSGQNNIDEIKRGIDEIVGRVIVLSIYYSIGVTTDKEVNWKLSDLKEEYREVVAKCLTLFF